MLNIGQTLIKRYNTLRVLIQITTISGTKYNGDGKRLVVYHALFKFPGFFLSFNMLKIFGLSAG